MYLALLFLLLTSCFSVSKPSIVQGPMPETKQLVYIHPIEDKVESFNSPKMIDFLTENMSRRLTDKEFLFDPMKKNAAKIHVFLELIECNPSERPPTETTISLHVKVYEVHLDKPRLILQEVLTSHTLLEEHKSPFESFTTKDELYISPIGLAMIKLSKEASRRIENVLTTK